MVVEVALRSIRTLAANYYQQMFYYLDRLFRRYGLALTNVERMYEPAFLAFLCAME